MQYRPGENSHEVKKVFYSPFDRRMHTESARECSQRISKADLPGENFPVQNCWKQLGEEVGCTDHCHEHLLSASLDEIRGFRQIFGRSSDLSDCQQLSDCCSYCLTLHASFSLSFLSSLISSSLSFSLVNNFNQIFRKVFPVPLKNSSVSLTFTMRVGGKNKPQANHC